MSSLAAARADGFYRPKNFDPNKMEVRKSDFQHEKPFKVVEGERVGGSKVRYETPFHVRCEGCQNMVAKGVRFNSIKTWVDNFHSTKIYEFRMKCPQCPQRFVVRTDPQNCDYIYVSGARRIFQTSDCTDESRIRDEAEQKKIREDPFARLENEYKDKIQFSGFQDEIQKIEEMQSRGREDFQLNRMLRKNVRAIREGQKLQQPKMVMVPLLAPTVQDMVKADEVQFKQAKKKLIKKEDKPQTQRQKLKEKMKRLNPKLQNQLQNQIKKMNNSTTSFYK